jgi:hypothetical protein
VRSPAEAAAPPPAALLGHVEAPDEATAIKKAIEEFSVAPTVKKAIDQFAIESAYRKRLLAPEARTR